MVVVETSVNGGNRCLRRPCKRPALTTVIRRYPRILSHHCTLPHWCFPVLTSCGGRVTGRLRIDRAMYGPGRDGRRAGLNPRPQCQMHLPDSRPAPAEPRPPVAV